MVVESMEQTKKAENISEEKLIKEIGMVAESVEKLAKEQEIVSKEILQDQEDESTRKLLTNPSAIALTEQKHEAGEGISKVKKTVRQLFILYLTNQFVSRAVNVRANTLISKGFNIVGEDKKGVEACEKLIEDSGGANLFYQLSTNTDIAGDGFLEKTYNLKGTKILKLKHVHPLTLGFKKNLKTDRIIVDQKTKQPVGYVQYFIDEHGLETEKDVDKKKISHLRFNTLGDEFTGISTIQPGYNTIVRLMNMEYSAAEAAVKTANPLIVGKCNTKSPMQIAQWGTILGRINGRDQVFLPQDMELDFMSPGPQNFSDYASYFLDATVACFGTPKSILLGDSGGSGNRAEGVILSRHFYYEIRANQKYMEEFFNDIFKEYGEIAKFKPPKLVFEDIAEDATLAAESAISLFEGGIVTRDEARQMIGLDPKAEGNFVQGASADIKKENRTAQFPATQGKKAGSQREIKNTQKKNEFSLVKNDKK